MKVESDHCLVDFSSTTLKYTEILAERPQSRASLWMLSPLLNNFFDKNDHASSYVLKVETKNFISVFVSWIGPGITELSAIKYVNTRLDLYDQKVLGSAVH